jgi:hypothetical protein
VVEDDVHAAPAGQLARQLREVFRPVIDAALGAQPLAGAALLVAARGREHARAARGGELNRRRADAVGTRSTSSS